MILLIIKSRRSWIEQIVMAIFFLIVYVIEMLAFQHTAPIVFSTIQLVYGLIVFAFVYLEVGTYKVTTTRLKLTTNLKVWFAIFAATVIGMLLLEELPATVVTTLTTRHVVVNTLIALTAGFFEESLVRGLVFSAFLQNAKNHRRSLKFTKAAIYSSLVFGGLHMMNMSQDNIEGVVQQVVYTVVLGLLLVVIRVTTNTLIWPIALHFLIDWQPDIASGAVPDATNWLVIIGVFGVILVASVIYLVKFDREYEKQQAQSTIG